MRIQHDENDNVSDVIEKDILNQKNIIQLEIVDGFLTFRKE